MRSFVVIVALLLHQVMGDASTQLVTTASNQFANNLYEKLSHNDGNVLVCPVSLHVALALVHQGAAGSTASELALVLKLNTSNENIKDSYKAVLTGIKDNTLKIATKLFPAAGFQLNQDYVTTARNNFLSDVGKVNYSDAIAAANTINKYVEEKTNKKIHNLISPDAITEQTRLVIVNAVHFQATWKQTFPTAYEGEFKVSPDKKVKTKMMTQTDYFDYKEDEALGAKVLKMDYTDGGYSMLFILPTQEDGLAAVEAKLATMELPKILDGLRHSRVEVTIPKFNLEKTINLKDVLINMGVKSMFSSRADLHNIASGENLYVSDVIQKTFINVHENGTEAAAATAILEALSASFLMTTFFARSPFHFYLIHSGTPTLVLFEGRFARPQEQNTHEITSINPQQENQYFADQRSKPGNNLQGISNIDHTQSLNKKPTGSEGVTHFGHHNNQNTDNNNQIYPTQTQGQLNQAGYQQLTQNYGTFNSNQQEYRPNHAHQQLGTSPQYQSQQNQGQRYEADEHLAAQRYNQQQWYHHPNQQQYQQPYQQPYQQSYQQPNQQQY